MPTFFTILYFKNNKFVCSRKLTLCFIQTALKKKARSENKIGFVKLCYLKHAFAITEMLGDIFAEIPYLT